MASIQLREPKLLLLLGLHSHHESCSHGNRPFSFTYRCVVACGERSRCFECCSDTASSPCRLMTYLRSSRNDRAVPNGTARGDRLLLVCRRMTARVLGAFAVTLADLLRSALFRLALETIRFLTAALVLVVPLHRTTSYRIRYSIFISQCLWMRHRSGKRITNSP